MKKHEKTQNLYRKENHRNKSLSNVYVTLVNKLKTQKLDSSKHVPNMESGSSLLMALKHFEKKLSNLRVDLLDQSRQLADIVMTINKLKVEHQIKCVRNKPPKDLIKLLQNKDIDISKVDLLSEDQLARLMTKLNKLHDETKQQTKCKTLKVPKSFIKSKMSIRPTNNNKPRKKDPCSKNAYMKPINVMRVDGFHNRLKSLLRSSHSQRKHSPSRRTIPGMAVPEHPPSRRTVPRMAVPERPRKQINYYDVPHRTNNKKRKKGRRTATVATGTETNSLFFELWKEAMESQYLLNRHGLQKCYSAASSKVSYTRSPSPALKWH